MCTARMYDVSEQAVGRIGNVEDFVGRREGGNGDVTNHAVCVASL